MRVLWYNQGIETVLFPLHTLSMYTQQILVVQAFSLVDMLSHSGWYMFT